MGGRPTLTQAQSWDPDSLRQAADAWDAAAADVHREFDVVVRGVQETQDFWTGDAADAARERALSLSGSSTTLARALVAAAVAARDGAGQIATARDELLAAVASMRSQGFTVADDGAVTAPAQPPAFVLSQCAGNERL